MCPCPRGKVPCPGVCVTVRAPLSDTPLKKNKFHFKHGLGKKNKKPHLRSSAGLSAGNSKHGPDRWLAHARGLLPMGAVPRSRTTRASSRRSSRYQEPKQAITVPSGAAKTQRPPLRHEKDGATKVFLFGPGRARRKQPNGGLGSGSKIFVASLLGFF